MNSALNRTGVAYLTNKSGGSVAKGDIVVLDTTTNESFTTTTTAALSTRQIGVVIEPNGIANNAVGAIALSGYVALTNLSASASRGDFLKTHTVAKQAAPHASPQVEGDFAQVLGTGTSPAAWLFGPNPPASSGGAVNNGVVQGRLTTESGVPMSTTDRSAQATIYFTPYGGNTIALYTGSAWTVVTFSELSLALSGLTSGKNYDVFVDYNGGSPQLVLSAAWTSDTVRADAITLQDGVYVKSGTTAYRLVGTIRTTSSTTTEDSEAKRFVANIYNTVRRSLYTAPGYSNGNTTTSYTTTSTTMTEVNGGTNSKVEYVLPLAMSVSLGFTAVADSGTGTGLVGLGIDSTSTASFALSVPSTTRLAGAAFQEVAQALGYHFSSLLMGTTAGTLTVFADRARLGDAADPHLTFVSGSLFI